MPRCAAQVMDRLLVVGIHTCGCGFCRGRGKSCNSRSVVVDAITGGPLEYMSGGPRFSARLMS